MKTIISSLLLLAAGTVAAYAEGTEVKSTSEFSNNKVYLLLRHTLNTNTGRGFMYAEGDKTPNLVTRSTSQVDTTAATAQFSMHYSAKEKAYYLFNLGKEMFANGNAGNAVLTTDAVDCVPIRSDLAEAWLLDCGGYMLGLKEDDGNSVFFDDVTKQGGRRMGCVFLIYEKDGVTLTNAQVDAIEAKIAAGRESVLSTYRKFLSDASKVSDVGSLALYIGDYDLDELSYALDHADNYSLAEIEAIYQKAVASRYPKQGRYYRMHNYKRPSTTHATNILSTTTTGELQVRTYKDPVFGTAAEGYSDDLNLFRFYHVDGDPTQVKIEAAAFPHSYLAGGSNQEIVKLSSSSDDATVYELSSVRVNTRPFRIALPAKGTWLSVTNPDYQLWGYNASEVYNQWFFEEIKTISVPVDANGYATACLPCGVALPEGVKAYTVTDVDNGKAYVEEVASPVHLNTPIILKAAAGAGAIELTIEDNRNWIASEMTGNLHATESTPGRYVPVFGADGISFKYEAAADEPSLPGSCYIVSDDKGALTTVMGANPNAGIEEISVDQAAARELYDLAGRRVTGTPRPGVYINATTRTAVQVK